MTSSHYLSWPADTFVEGVTVLANSRLMSVLSLFISVCYVVNLVILRKHSAERRCKDLSTCASHITMVVLFFRRATFLFLHPSSTFTWNKMVAVFYMVLTPMLNPNHLHTQTFRSENHQEEIVEHKEVRDGVKEQ